jgi:hypothetical protein
MRSGIPCPGGMCFHAVPNAPWEGGKGMATVDAGMLELFGVAIWEPAEVDELRGAASAIPWRQARSSLIGARLAWMPGRLPPNGLCERLKRLTILAFKAPTMKSEMKRQTSTGLQRVIVGALATAGASGANGATVQVTFGNNILTSNTAANFTPDLTGDGDADVAGVSSAGVSARVNRLVGLNWIAYGRVGGPFVFASVQDMGMQMGYRPGPVTNRGLVPLIFSDPRVNSGLNTMGWLDVSSEASNSLQQVQIHRLIFDDSSTTEPTVGDYNDAPYNEMVFSAVPEPGSNLALLALGAGGLTLRRRLKRAA